MKKNQKTTEDLVANLDFEFWDKDTKKLWAKTFEKHGIKFEMIPFKGYFLTAVEEKAKLALADYVINYHHRGDGIDWLNSWIPGIKDYADNCKGAFKMPK